MQMRYIPFHSPIKLLGVQPCKGRDLGVGGGEVSKGMGPSKRGGRKRFDGVVCPWDMALG